MFMLWARSPLVVRQVIKSTIRISIRCSWLDSTITQPSYLHILTSTLHKTSWKAECKMYLKMPINKLTKEYNTTKKQQRTFSGFAQHEIIHHSTTSCKCLALNFSQWVVANITDLLLLPKFDYFAGFSLWKSTETALSFFFIHGTKKIHFFICKFSLSILR